MVLFHELDIGHSPEVGETMDLISEVCASQSVCLMFLICLIIVYQKPVEHCLSHFPRMMCLGNVYGEIKRHEALRFFCINKLS